MDPLFVGVVAVLLAERGFELWLSRRHVRALVARGGRVVSRDHYGLLVAIHAGAILGLVAEHTWAPYARTGAWTWPLLGLAALAFALRFWVMRTLGNRWATRVVVVPGEAAVGAGPYRFVRHPNYVAVVIELAAVPLAFGAVATALVAGTVHVVALRTRIHVEERALRGSGPYDAVVARGRVFGADPTNRHMTTRPHPGRMSSARAAYIAAASDGYREAHEALARVVARHFPKAEPVFEHDMPAWRIARPHGAPMPEVSGTIDPSIVFLGLVERKAGLTVHLWYPGDYYLFDTHKAQLSKAGFKVMRGCLVYARKQPFPAKAIDALLQAIKLQDRGGPRKDPRRA